MTRTQLLNEVTRDFGYADSPASAVSNRIISYLDDRHRRLTTLPGLELYRMQTETITLTASTAEYTLDMPVQKLIHVVDTTNDVPLTEQTLDWYRRVDPDPQTGTQEFWIPMRWGPALRNISTGSGSGLWVVSSSATDAGGGGIATNVETIDSNGSVTQTNATTNGTTRVQVGTATNHMRLLRFSATTAAVGVLSLYDAAAAGNEVSRIALGRTNANFLTIALWPTPSSADTLRIDFLHWIRNFSVAYDEPQLPHDFHYLVALGAKIDEARKKGPEFAARIKDWQQEWYEGIRLLYAFTSQDQRLIVPGATAQRGRSNLGPAFPAGMW